MSFLGTAVEFILFIHPLSDVVVLCFAVEVVVITFGICTGCGSFIVECCGFVRFDCFLGFDTVAMFSKAVVCLYFAIRFTHKV